MADVWVLEIGEYSDRYVHSVYSTEEAADEAERLMRLAFREPSISISRFTLDERMPVREDRLPFDVTIKDGSITISKPSGYWIGRDELNDYEQQDIWFDEWDGKSWQPPSLLQQRTEPGLYGWGIKVMAKDADHAAKIAKDKFAQWWAEREGIA